MTLVTKKVVVDAPLERVFAYVNEPSTMAEWLPGMVEVREVIGTGLGQQYEWTYKMAGLLLRGQSTVVELVANERAVHQSIGTIGSTWTYTVEPRDEGTALTVEVEYTVPVPVLGKLVERVAVRHDARDLETALVNVKEMLEA
jgi:carbon monoxide dehydrogenase subunit G